MSVTQGRKPVEMWRCRFDGREMRFDKRNTHRCTMLQTCRNQYRQKCDSDSDFSSLYPTFWAYDEAVQSNRFPDNVNPIPDYMGNPSPALPAQPVAAVTAGDEDMDDAGEEVPAEPADTSGGEFKPEPVSDNVVAAGTDPSFQPKSGIIGEEPEAPQAAGDAPQDVARRNVSKVISTIAGKAAETKVLAQKKIGNKQEWGWRPIILVLHELKMWAFKAKETSKYFKLSTDAIKLLCNGYYNTFGDSPLVRLTGKEFSEDSVDFLSAELTVYGDFYIENAPQAFGHVRDAMKKFRERKQSIVLHEVKS